MSEVTPPQTTVQTTDAICEVIATVVSCVKGGRETPAGGPATFSAAQPVPGSGVAASIAAVAAPVAYLVQVCTRHESGSLDIRVAARKFKSFHDLQKTVRTHCGDGAPEPPAKKLFGNEGDALSTKRRRELQRFLDELLSDPRTLSIPAVRDFLCLDAAPAETIPRVRPGDWGSASAPPASVPAPSSLAPPPPAMVASCPPVPLRSSAPAAAADHSSAQLDTLRTELQVAKSQAVAEEERARQLEERTRYLQGLVELHDTELAGVKRRAEDRIAALQAELGDKQQQVFLLVKKANAIEMEAETLREEAVRAREKCAMHDRAVAETAAARDRLKGRVSELEMRCASLQASLERAAEEAAVAQLGRPRTLTNPNPSLPAPPKEKEALKSSDPSSQQTPPAAAPGVGASSPVAPAAQPAARPASPASLSAAPAPVIPAPVASAPAVASALTAILGPQPDVQQQQQQRKLDDLAKRAELFDQKCRDLEGELQDAAAARTILERAATDTDALRERVSELAGKLGASEAEKEGLKREHSEALAKAIAQVKEIEAQRDEALERVKTLEGAVEAKTAYIAEIDGRQSKAIGEAFSLMPEVERLQQQVAALSAELDRREHTAALLRFQSRQLLHEVALLTAEREKSGTTGHNSQLVYSNQIAEGMALIEQIEVQNAGYREQLSHLGAEIAHVRDDAEEEARRLRSELARLQEELAAERLTSLKLQTIITKHGIARDEADEQQLLAIQKLEKDHEALLSENADIKQRYFYSLAVSIKLHTQGTWEVAKLYNEELPKEHVPIDQWPKWISRKMAESSMPIARQSAPTRTFSFSTFPPGSAPSASSLHQHAASQPPGMQQQSPRQPIDQGALQMHPKDPPPIPPVPGKQ